MAIGFAKVDFVQRSAGQNACAKSAYIGRDKIHFQGTAFAEAKVYDWSHKDKVVFNEILLPKQVNKIFLNPEVLWNEAEAKENRRNSQTAMEMVLALPDDLEVSIEDKIELIKSYVQENYVDKGLGAQIAIHPPESKIQFDPEADELENFDHNWHAHVLLTTRLFKENGEELEDAKARHLMLVIRRNKLGIPSVISGPDNGKLWGEHQNRFFESKGMSLRVDPNGAIAQIHLGPTRLRGRAFSLLEKNEELKQLNIEEIKNPEKLLEKVIEQNNIFTPDDLRRIIDKFVGHQYASELVKAVIDQPNVIQLLDPETGKLPIDPKTDKPIEKYTTVEVLLEEKKCLTHASNIQKKDALKVNANECFEQFSSHLTPEQKVAFQNILNGSRLSCIEGHAGTGKSHLLVALKNAYEKEGYAVRAFGPDSATAQVLKEKGFSTADNVYHFLFSINRAETNQKSEYWKANQLKRGHPYFSKGKEKESQKSLKINEGKEVWLIDEVTKLGNRPMLQILKFAEKYDAQIVLSGGASQLLPVERGCLYDVLAKRYGSQKLEDIQRQKDQYQKEISQKIAKGDLAGAIDRLVASNSIIWVDSRQDEKIRSSRDFVETAFGNEDYERKLKDKEKAIEELVKKWALDREAFPASSSLIIACSNHEMRTINEMVRTYRKERGEIAKQDFKCDTQFGEIFVSQGDTIEFSSNDKKLGVTNGMQGTLIKASSEQFTILMRDKKEKVREISFDPNEYASFKLGYATTYFRSQGRTVDRAYVLHSLHTNREMFYVGLTRHVHKAYFFVPKSNLNYLSYLKAQAAGYQDKYSKYLAINDYFQNKDTQKYLEDLIEQTSQSTPKFSTTDFVTDDQFNRLEKDQHLADLKSSSSLFSRLKGHTLTIWDKANTKIENFLQAKQQNKKESAFFSPIIESLPKKIRIQELGLAEPSAQEYRQAFIRSLLQSNKQPSSENQFWENLTPVHQKFVRDYLKQANKAWSLQQKFEKVNNGDFGRINQSKHFDEWQKVCSKRDELAYQLVQTLPKEAIDQLFGEKYLENLKSQSNHHDQSLQKQPEDDVQQFKDNKEALFKREKLSTIGSIKNISFEQEKLLKSYRQVSEESASLYALVQAESEGIKNNEKSTSHYMAWQVVCGKRNAAAHQLVGALSKENLSLALGQKSLEFLIDQAQRHERLSNRKENRFLDLETKLKDNLESLLYRLFPDGPTRKERTKWRFGAKGSLAVICQGDKLGSFYSFEEGNGGGPLKLIQTILGLDAKDAKEWAQSFLGEAKNLDVPSQFKMERKQVNDKSEWIAIKPNRDHPAPSLKKMPGSKLAIYCREEARYAYCDEKGDLLFYTLRLIDKEGKKSVLPLSYGIEKGKDEMPHWEFRIYQKTQRTLYNLQLLQQNPSAKVVIVEGEKTAVAANKLLNAQGMICLTWSGGAKATPLTDWSSLHGRDVIIWPDNDQAGFKAAESICSELRKEGVKSLRVVDQDVLVKVFPPKWDLADPLPAEAKQTLIRDLLMSANEKSVDITHLTFAVDKSNKEIELLKVKEILWRVEERLRPELEKTLKNTPQEIRSALINETVAIFQQKNQIAQDIKTQLMVDEHQADRLAFQSLLYKAQYGKEPSKANILEMKEILQNSKILPKCKSDDHLEKEMHSLAVDKALAAVFGRQINEKKLSEITLSVEREISKTNQEILQQVALQRMAKLQQSVIQGMDLSL